MQDYGVAFVNKEAYNGILIDSNAIANLSAFRLMYNDIYTAKIYSAASSMPGNTTHNNAVWPLQTHATIPLIS